MGSDPQQGLSFYSVELWHTTSVWHGDVVPGAYGVYTTSTTQHWTDVIGGVHDTDIIIP